MSAKVTTSELTERLTVARKVTSEAYGADESFNHAVRISVAGGMVCLTVADRSRTRATTMFPALGGRMGACEVGPRDLTIALKGVQDHEEIYLTRIKDGLGITRNGHDVVVPKVHGYTKISVSRWREVGSWKGDVFRMAMLYMVPVSRRSSKDKRLHGTLIHGRHCVTTDGHRMHMGRLRGRMRGKATISAAAAVLASKTVGPDDRVVLAVSEEKGWKMSRLLYGEWEICSRNDNFPGYKQLLRDIVKNDTVAQGLAVEELARGLRSLEAGTATVCLSIGNALLGLEVVRDGDEDGELKSFTIPADTRGVLRRMLFDPMYLRDMFETPEKIVSLGMCSDLDPVVMYNQEGSIQSMCMPKRM